MKLGGDRVRFAVRIATLTIDEISVPIASIPAVIRVAMVPEFLTRVVAGWLLARSRGWPTSTLPTILEPALTRAERPHERFRIVCALAETGSSVGVPFLEDWVAETEKTGSPVREVRIP
jgi:hypothetical protein